jgi:hypothetical protein
LLRKTLKKISDAPFAGIPKFGLLLQEVIVKILFVQERISPQQNIPATFSHRGEFHEWQN